MSVSIKQIAEKGHVVTPRFGDEGVEVAPIGVREASTFPGFCEVHEGEFAEFESKKQMTTAEHFYRQAFRTICREIYTQRHHKQKLKASLMEYRRLRETFIAGRLQKVQGPRSSMFAGVKFVNDALEVRVVEQLDSISRNLADLNALYYGVLDELQNAADKIWMSAATLDFQLPVCLSGIGVLPYRQDNVIMRAVCFLAIIPEAIETKIIIGALKEHERALEVYLHDESSSAVLGRLESWMCHGSDHWFMTPSAWDAIPQARKSAICERILDPSPSIAEPVGFSILDGVRKHILSFAEGQLRDGKIAPANIDNIEKFIAAERAKLN